MGVSTVSNRPQARRDGIIAEPREDGLVLYDIDALCIHRLDPVTARVWKAANGRRGVLRLAAATRVNKPSVVAALDELAGCELLVGDSAAPRVNEASREAALVAWN
jgi:hypothetical protein